MTNKLGLLPPKPGAIPLRLATYIKPSALPTPPDTFGHMQTVTNWGMLGNGPGPDNPPQIPDGVGDCAICGPEHQIMYHHAISGKKVSFSTPTTIQNYSEITGYVLGDDSTDNGTAIEEMAKHWQSVGFKDDNGNRHQVVGFVDLNPGDLREFWVAMYLFGSVGLGFDLPDTAEEQTSRGLAWDAVPGSKSLGGHYVPAFNKLNAGMNVGVSWGAPQAFTSRFFQAYNNQGVVVLDETMMVNAKSIDGFDDAQLRDDLHQLKLQRRHRGWW